VIDYHNAWWKPETKRAVILELHSVQLDINS